MVLSLELSVDSVAVATVGLGGHVYEQVRVPRPRGESAAETVEVVAGLSGELLEALPADAILTGVGVGVAGVTRRSDGFVQLAPNLGWRNVALGEMLASALGLQGSGPRRQRSRPGRSRRVPARA